MDDHDLLMRIHEKVLQIKDGDTGDLPDLKRVIQGMDTKFEAKFQSGDHRMDCLDRRITRSETYLKVLGTAITVAGASIVKLFLGK